MVVDIGKDDFVDLLFVIGVVKFKVFVYIGFIRGWLVDSSQSVGNGVGVGYWGVVNDEFYDFVGVEVIVVLVYVVCVV